VQLPAEVAEQNTPDLVGAIERRIVSGYQADTWFSEEHNISQHGLSHGPDGLWYCGEAIAVPNAHNLRQMILQELHDAPYSGHFGVGKTLRAVQRSWWWPGLRNDVIEYVTCCPVCQRDKPSNQRPYGLLVPLPIPDRPWASVSMDLITGLPLTIKGHDCIVVWVDRLTKMTHFAPCTTKKTGAELAELFVHNVVRLHGVPVDMVTDRDVRFQSDFWNNIIRMLGTKRAMFTAFHPQTDGQTERMNRVLEEMLRHYVSTQQNDWDEHLDMAEFAINNAVSESTKQTPFQMVYGFHPLTPLSRDMLKHRRASVPASGYAEIIKVNIARAKACLQRAQDKMKAYADAHRADMSFDVGPHVLLSTANIKLASPGALKLLPK
jgi:hypothetical protein